jgi:DNA-binding response OmpR family regulator
VIEPDQISLVDSNSQFVDFQVGPVEPAEFRLRVQRLATEHDDDEVISFKDLILNTLTYQAELAGVPMDLTYMEYELLRFLVTNPTRVWSREQLLSRVWGYEYYGGARTVDVHVRRLRSKLGEERSSWIATVRSVGYRFG